MKSRIVQNVMQTRPSETASLKVDRQTHRKLLRMKVKTGKSIQRIIKDSVDMLENPPSTPKQIRGGGI